MKRGPVMTLTRVPRSLCSRQRLYSGMLHLLPDVFLDVLINEYLSSVEAKTLRLVSKKYRSIVDGSVSTLKPRDITRSQVMLPAISTRSCLKAGSKQCSWWLSSSDAPNNVCQGASNRKLIRCRQTESICQTILLQEGDLAQVFSNCRSLSLCMTRDTSGALQTRLGQLSALTGLSSLSIDWHWSLNDCIKYGHHWHLSWDDNTLDMVRQMDLSEISMPHTEIGHTR